MEVLSTTSFDANKTFSEGLRQRMKHLKRLLETKQLHPPSLTTLFHSTLKKYVDEI